MSRKFLFIIIGLLWCLNSGLAVATVPQAKTNAHSKQHHAKQQHAHKKNKKPAKHKRHSKKKHSHSHKPKAIPNDRRELTQSEHHSFVGSLGHSIGQHLVNLVYKTVETLRYSAYKLGGTHFDTSHGVYIVDCSEYVDNILHAAHPNAFNSLVNSTGTYKPTTQHYYEFFNELSDEKKRYWNRIDDATQLQPGDILVFRNKHMPRSGVAGHVMIVMDKPIADTSGYLVRVADSAPVGHSEDTRQHRVSGIGIGTLLLKVNSETGRPSAYAWKVGSHWVKNVNFAMARPVGVESG